MAIAQSTFGASNWVVGTLTTVIGHAKDYLAKRKLYRDTYNELSELTNRELADLGISRSMIRSLALEAAKAA
ncbi:DUF1127 domain-containing protein [Actibacterium pelagium]|uniref:YjiS-like domain-containing protein n=1 Tax=Actibacterium pelagium TaxID=2029103 RepID=A0A917EKF4_9RHOB|nr:DUF1127 domain-containing protein [Actibacterium pelagium]GGE47445.1 hypothetical protein GCM10011517_14050 [Actibacterium pelagium]